MTARTEDIEPAAVYTAIEDEGTEHLGEWYVTREQGQHRLHVIWLPTEAEAAAVAAAAVAPDFDVTGWLDIGTGSGSSDVTR